MSTRLALCQCVDELLVIQDVALAVGEHGENLVLEGAVRSEISLKAIAADPAWEEQYATACTFTGNM